MNREARPHGLNRLALSATLHCVTGCSIGEVTGMVIGSGGRLSNQATIVLSVVLAFLFGYLLTMAPLLRSGMAFRTALGLALASDSVSIVVMEGVDNAVMLLMPGAMDAHPSDPRFWVSLGIALVLGALATFPVVRMLIRRGRGHALVHGMRDGVGGHGSHPHH